MIEVITAKNEWDLLIEDVDAYDFYSTYDYHDVSITNEEKPVLIKYTEGEIIIGIPLLICKIHDITFFDATSVYGYGGPISKNLSQNFDNQFFKQEIIKFFKDHKIVSVFSRLNPYLPHQETILENIGEVKIKGSVVMIDQEQSLDVQRQNYQKRIKSHINKARKICKIKKALSKDDITKFIHLYYENMERVEAKKSFFFNEDYFYRFTHNDKSKIEILLASLSDTNEIICGAMFIKSKDIIQYHLSGTKADYLDTGALKLLIDEMRIKGTHENYKVLNLGGGLNSKDDSLLRFKKSFSKTLKKFSVWQCVINDHIYKKLTQTVQADNIDFFPAYRISK